MKIEKAELAELKEQLNSCKRLYRSHERNSLWYRDDAGFHVECFGDADSCGPEIITAHELPQTTYKNYREEIELLNGLYALSRDELDYVFPQAKREYWHIKEAMFYATLFGNQNHCGGYVLNESSMSETKSMPKDLKIRIFAVDYYKNLRRKRK